MSFNLNEEIIDGHLVTAETKKLWSVEMDLAKRLLEVCKKHHLRIWADGGTLLGAVRHNGFIPWDDDMDFAMMRDDYNRLIEIGPKEFQEPYFFQSIYSDNTWGSMIKIRNSNTSMIDSTYKEWKNRNYGVCIDVFVLDAIPENDNSFKKEFEIVQRKRRLLTRYGVYKPKYESIRAIIRTLYVKLYFLMNDYYNVQKSIVDLLSSYEIAKHQYCTLIDFYAASYYSIEKVNRRECAWYHETIELPFFDMMIPVPKDYHKLLTCLYGDYMTPIKGRSIHSIICYDCDKSYKEVLAELDTCK